MEKFSKGEYVMHKGYIVKFIEYRDEDFTCLIKPFKEKEQLVWTKDIGVIHWKCLLNIHKWNYTSEKGSPTIRKCKRCKAKQVNKSNIYGKNTYWVDALYTELEL